MPRTKKAKSKSTKRSAARKPTKRSSARQNQQRRVAKRVSKAKRKRTVKFTVFIAWAGGRSRDVGENLRGSLRTIVPRLELLFSPTLPPGAAWATRLQAWLRRADYAILCVTKESLSSPWMGFEAGASLKALTRATVCPLLFDVQSSDLATSPLSIFQAKEFSNRGFSELCKYLGRRTRMNSDVVSDNLKNVWGTLDAEVKRILHSPP